MSVERDELHRLVKDLTDDQVLFVLADVRRRLVERRKDRPWPPAWFGAAPGRRGDTAGPPMGGTLGS